MEESPFRFKTWGETFWTLVWTIFFVVVKIILCALFFLAFFFGKKRRRRRKNKTDKVNDDDDDDDVATHAAAFGGIQFDAKKRTFVKTYNHVFHSQLLHRSRERHDGENRLKGTGADVRVAVGRRVSYYAFHFFFPPFLTRGTRDGGDGRLKCRVVCDGLRRIADANVTPHRDIRVHWTYLRPRGPDVPVFTVHLPSLDLVLRKSNPQKWKRF